MAWTSILRCADGSYHVGSTVHLERRLCEHNEGEGAAYTRRRRPVEIVWSVEMSSVRDAFHLEKQIQNWSRAEREALIAGRYGDLPALARAHSRRGSDCRRSTAELQLWHQLVAHTSRGLDGRSLAGAPSLLDHGGVAARGPWSPSPGAGGIVEA